MNDVVYLIFVRSIIIALARMILSRLPKCVLSDNCIFRWFFNLKVCDSHPQSIIHLLELFNNQIFTELLIVSLGDKPVV